MRYIESRPKGRLYTYKTLREKGIPFTPEYLRRLVKEGRFPKPLYLSERRPAWTEEALDAHIERLERERNKSAA